MGKLKISSSIPRKELRKAHKQAAKEKKQQRHARRAAQKASTEAVSDKPATRPAIGGKSEGGGKKNKRDAAKSSGGGGAGGGTRRKRWRPEEIDPMIAAEDAELERLERLLGVSGPNAKKKRAKLEKEMAVEDGMGEDFGEFLSGLDRITKVVEGGGASGSSDDGREDQADWDFHEDVLAESSGGSGSNDGGRESSEDDDDSTFGGRGRELLAGVLDSEDELYGDEDTESEKEEEEEEEEKEEGEEEGTDLEHAPAGRRQANSASKGADESDEDQEDSEDGDRDEQEDEPRARGTAGYGDEDDDGERAQGEGEEESEDFKRHTYRPKPGQDIYGRATGAESSGAAPAKYIPPHLRAAAAAAVVAGGGAGADSAKRLKVQRIVNGIMNRLSEETLEPVTARLRDTYRGYSTTEVNEALWEATRAVCVHDKHVMTTLIPSFAAVIAALNISLGADVGGFFLETIARELDAEVLGTKRVGGRGTGSNLLLLLAYLYNHGVAHCTLVYDIIGIMVDAFGPDEMELLLLLLRHSGYQLRSDDPQALKEIVAVVKDKSAAATATAAAAPASPPAAGANGANGSTLAEEAGRWKAAFGSGVPNSAGLASATRLAAPVSGDAAPGATAAAGGSRARYILDTILELQGNKRSRLQEQGQESGRRVRKWLGSVKAAKGGGAAGGDASLRVSWAELVSTESRGRWWRVGAAWAGRGSTAEKVAGEGANGAVDGGSAGEGGDGDGEGGLLALAARQRMNTDVRRSVFVAIVGSSDCEDALEKILRLNLKGAQEREVARVIVECCSQEGSYNPFYAHLAERVCDRQPKLRFTFQIAFWDALKTLDEGAARRAGSLARLMAHLVVRKQLSLTVLKTVEVTELSPSGLLLMRVFFHEIIAAGDDASFMEVFRRLARPAGTKEGGGHAAARDNTLVFLRGHLGPAPSGWDRDRRKAFRKRVKGACRLIEAIVTADELG